MNSGVWHEVRPEGSCPAGREYVKRQSGNVALPRFEEARSARFSGPIGLAADSRNA